MLKRVSIQNFKSLKDVTLDLQKINLLIGPNNSGKTNFLRALEFVANWNNGSIPQEFYITGLTFRNSDYINKFAIELTSDQIGTGEYHYRLVPEMSIIYDSSDSFVESSWDVLEDGSAKNHSELSYDPFFGATVDGIKSDIRSPNIGLFLKTQSDANKMGARIIKASLGKLKIYKPDPNKLDKPGPIGTGEESVSADASNLVGFLDLMGIKYRRTVFNQIETDLHTCVPEFAEIKLEDVKRTEELIKFYDEDKRNNSFRRLGLADGKQGVTYWSDELSEGTLYFLALLCIINQPNPPKLLLLEEPEKGIHPRRLFEVLQFILRLVEEKDVQVIMTTHSPIVVDMFKDMPESVFIFDKDEEGATHVKNLQRDVIEPETVKSEELGVEPPHYTDSLGDAWTVGFLGGVPK